MNMRFCSVILWIMAIFAFILCFNVPAACAFAHNFYAILITTIIINSCMGIYLFKNSWKD